MYFLYLAQLIFRYCKYLQINTDSTDRCQSVIGPRRGKAAGQRFSECGVQCVCIYRSDLVLQYSFSSPEPYSIVLWISWNVIWRPAIVGTPCPCHIPLRASANRPL